MPSAAGTSVPGESGTESLGTYVRRAYRSAGLIVQPRMGFSDPGQMRSGLVATRRATANTIGTLTLDSYTRVRDEKSAKQALDEGRPLNGYPLGTHPAETTLKLLRGVQTADFPVQVRHGSADPEQIISSMVSAGLVATEGGPVSYCLPYGRVPLRESVANWRLSCRLLASARETVGEPHLETFGGCLLGQLCPPSLLVAVSVLEAMFFRQQGIRSVSLSYAQQTSPSQDMDAIAALRRLARRFLSTTDQHVVVYAYMGMYPRTRGGARALLAEAAQLAARTASERLIVKTVAEAHRIPSISENVEALEMAAAVADVPAAGADRRLAGDTEILAEATSLVECVLNLSSDIGDGLIQAFARGYLDVPFCLHPDNAGRSSSYIDGTGKLRWASTGTMPIRCERVAGREHRVSSAELLDSLSYVLHKFDDAAALAVPAGASARQPIGVNQ